MTAIDFYSLCVQPSSLQYRHLSLILAMLSNIVYQSPQCLVSGPSANQSSEMCTLVFCGLAPAPFLYSIRSLLLLWMVCMELHVIPTDFVVPAEVCSERTSHLLFHLRTLLELEG